MEEAPAYPIEKVLAEIIKDSRGNPAIKVTVAAGGIAASFSVPSGASTGSREARELRDSDGRGLKNASEKVNKVLAPLLVGRNVLAQNEIDRIMLTADGTTDKSNLGGNAIVGVSIACAKAAAKVSKKETWEYLRTLAEIKSSAKRPTSPYLYMNLLNGGLHAKNGLAFQEYLVVPQTENVGNAINIGIEIANTLKEIIIKHLGEGAVAEGDEGGFAPKVSDVRQPLFMLREAIKQNDLEKEVRLALDVASSSFFNGQTYDVDGKKLSAAELADLYASLEAEFNLLSIEDPFQEEDFENFSAFKKRLPLLMLVGDDLTVTNINSLKKAIDENSIGGMIVKPNQVGTLTETLETMRLARDNDIELIVSHRSGETDDDFIADLAYAFHVYGLKAGAPTRPERMVKYKRLENIINKEK